MLHGGDQQVGLGLFFFDTMKFGTHSLSTGTHMELEYVFHMCLILQLLLVVGLSLTLQDVTGAHATSSVHVQWSGLSAFIHRSCFMTPTHPPSN